MGRKRTAGLVKRGNLWHIDKQVDGIRVLQSTGTDRLIEAEKYLVNKLETIRQARVYGIRPKRIFREAATKFLLDHQHKKRSILDDAGRLKILDKFIGDLPLDKIDMETLEPYIEAREEEGVKARTINHGLKIVSYILKLAATEWKEDGLSWLASAPKIKLLAEDDNREPYPLNWQEQEKLFSFLPGYLKDMALFAVNTGCRDQEICQLRWDWEVLVSLPEMQSVFIIPGEYTKNGLDRLVVLNEIARSVIEKQREKQTRFVFTYEGECLSRMTNKAWYRAKRSAELDVRVHDLKHTFGRRLRAAGVCFEDRQDLLGHKSSKGITTHYSLAELFNLWLAANKVCGEQQKSVILLRTARVEEASKNSLTQKSRKGSLAYFLGGS